MQKIVNPIRQPKVESFFREEGKTESVNCFIVLPVNSVEFINRHPRTGTEVTSTRSFLRWWLSNFLSAVYLKR